MPGSGTSPVFLPLKALRIEQVKKPATADACGRNAEERADNATKDMIASQAHETEIAKAAAAERASRLNGARCSC